MMITRLFSRVEEEIFFCVVVYLFVLLKDLNWFGANLKKKWAASLYSSCAVGQSAVKLVSIKKQT